MEDYYVPRTAKIATFGERLRQGGSLEIVLVLEENNCIVPDYECIDDNIGVLDYGIQYNRGMGVAKY
ncbi:MAG: hypothetical protein L3J22_00885 [Xanthomonadales bacterium]|nr:hypothetical protein [Xanthomonadales bacterium]